MLTLLASIALAQTPPCEPFTMPDTLEGDHFWIEWDPAVADPEIAQEVLDWSEEARRVYTDELGYDIPDRTVLIRMEDSPAAGGLTTTVECPGGGIAPHITLFSTGPGSPGQNTTMHEVVHQVQYAYMGSYIDAIQSWPWWMEGHATWLTWHADANDFEQTGPAYGYLNAPWLGLHQGPTAYTDPVASRFLYGTVLIALHLERLHGPDAVRATWDYGRTQTGSLIYFPDALAAAGVDFDPFWLDFMATTSVMDVPESFRYDPLAVEERVAVFPASGTPSEETRPGGLGLSVVHFRRVAGSSGKHLTVQFEGDPSVDWLAVLVRARGKGPGGKVDETVPLVVGSDGKGEATLLDFDGSKEGFLVVSPKSLSTEGFDYSWSATLQAPATDDGPKGCGCSQAEVGFWWPLIALFGLRRR